MGIQRILRVVLDTFLELQLDLLQHGFIEKLDILNDYIKYRAYTLITER